MTALKIVAVVLSCAMIAACTPVERVDSKPLTNSFNVNPINWNGGDQTVIYTKATRAAGDVTELCIAAFHSTGSNISRFSRDLLIRSNLITSFGTPIVTGLGFAPLATAQDPENVSAVEADCFLLETKWSPEFSGPHRITVRGGRGFQL